MVAGHVIGGTESVGMTVDEDSGWRSSYRLLEDLRMPLFTALSGYVYALRPLQDPRNYGRFVRGKVRRLLVPLLTVGTAFVLLQALTPGTNAESSVRDLWRVYVFGDPGHFWFLQAIFLILLLIGLLDACDVWRTPGLVVVAIVGTSALSVFVRVPAQFDFFSINGAIRLLPFFLLGYLLSRFSAVIPKRTRNVLLAVSVLLMSLRAMEIFGDRTLTGGADRVLGVCLGLAGIACLLLWRHRLTVSALARLGYFSFAIYLLHVFGTAPTRMVLGRLGVESETVVFALCLAAGLALPVLFEMTFGRISWVSWSFLGQRPYRPAPRDRSMKSAP